jgi:hypothetical protein
MAKTKRLRVVVGFAIQAKVIDDRGNELLVVKKLDQ